MEKAVDQLVRYSIHNGTGVPGVSPQGRPVIVRYSTASTRKASITPSLKQIQQYLIREVSTPHSFSPALRHDRQYALQAAMLGTYRKLIEYDAG